MYRRPDHPVKYRFRRIRRMRLIAFLPASALFCRRTATAANPAEDRAFTRKLYFNFRLVDLIIRTKYPQSIRKEVFAK